MSEEKIENENMENANQESQPRKNSKQKTKTPHEKITKLKSQNEKAYAKIEKWQEDIANTKTEIAQRDEEIKIEEGKLTISIFQEVDANLLAKLAEYFSSSEKNAAEVLATFIDERQKNEL